MAPGIRQLHDGTATALIDIASPGPRSAAERAAGDGWERRVLARIGDGERAALAELYARLGCAVHGRATQLTDDPLAAELITLGVFARIASSPHEFTAGGLRRSLLLLVDERATAWLADEAAEPARLQI